VLAFCKALGVTCEAFTLPGVPGEKETPAVADQDKLHATSAASRKDEAMPTIINLKGMKQKPLGLVDVGRRTIQSLLLSQGQSLRAVSQRLGHANPALTLRVYAHCMPTDDAQLAAGLTRMMA
jgi:integrase